MKLKRDDLLPALDALMPIAGRRTTLPALNCIRLEGNNGHLSLRASNLDCDSTINIPCTGKIAPVCVPARVLHAATDGDADTITFEPEEKLRLRVIGNGEARLACLDPEEFVAEPDKSGKAIGVNTSDLAKAIGSVAWAAALPDANGLPWVYVYLSPKEILCAGSDRKTFAYYSVPAIAVECKFCIPVAQAALLVDALKADGAVLRVGDKNAHVKHAAGELSVKLMENPGPDVRKAFQSSPSVLLGNFSRRTLLAEISKCCSLSLDSFAPVLIVFGPGGLSINFNGGANGYSSTIPGKFKPFEVKLDAFRLCKALKEFNTDEVAVSQWDVGIRIDGGLIVGVAGLCK